MSPPHAIRELKSQVLHATSGEPEVHFIGIALNIQQKQENSRRIRKTLLQRK